MSGLYRKDLLGQGMPSLWGGEIRVEDWVCQPYLATDKDGGMLGEAGGQVSFDMLSRHLSLWFCV